MTRLLEPFSCRSGCGTKRTGCGCSHATGHYLHEEVDLPPTAPLQIDPPQTDAPPKPISLDSWTDPNAARQPIHRATVPRPRPVRVQMARTQGQPKRSTSHNSNRSTRRVGSLPPGKPKIAPPKLLAPANNQSTTTTNPNTVRPVDVQIKVDPYPVNPLRPANGSSR